MCHFCMHLNSNYSDTCMTSFFLDKTPKPPSLKCITVMRTVFKIQQIDRTMSHSCNETYSMTGDGGGFPTRICFSLQILEHE